MVQINRRDSIYDICNLIEPGFRQYKLTREYFMVTY